MKVCAQCNNFFSDETELCPNDNLPLKDFDIASLVGKTIDGKYKVEEMLGMGGMGAVFRARHTFIHNDVAIKVIHPELALDRSVVERFLREARAAATIDHTNAIRVTDFGKAGDMLYLVMEFIRGVSMKDYLEKKQRLTIGETARIMKQVCSALDVAHSFQIVHRDLKPDNIMLKYNSRGEPFVKVVDFGIAKVKSSDSGGQALTNVGMIIGTASYMSPEQCQGAPVDHRSDIYSLGIIAYEALSGKKPFEAPSPMQVIVKHIIEAPPPLRTANAQLPAEVESVVMRAMEKNAAERYATAMEFAEQLSIVAAMFAENDNPSDPLLTAPTGNLPPLAPSPQVDSDQTYVPAAQASPAPSNDRAYVPAQPSNDRTYVPPQPNNDRTYVPAQSAKPVADNDRTVIGSNGQAAAGKKRKLLIVNDSKAIVMLLKHQLQQAGYQVVTQMDSVEAPVTIMSERPELIIVGIDMPKLSGPELCTMIRTKPSMSAVAQVPVLLYSSLSEDELNKKVLDCNASGFIHKNWTMERIISALSQY